MIMTRERVLKSSMCRHLLPAPAPEVVGELVETCLAYMDVAEKAKALMAWDNNALDTSGKDVVTGEPVRVACKEYRDAVSDVLDALAKLDTKERKE